MGIVEKIQIQLDFISKGFINPIGQASEKMNQFTNRTRKASTSMLDSANKQRMATKGTVRATKSNVGFLQVMRANGEQFKTMGKTQGMVNTRMGKFAFATRRAFHGLKEFKMEMLGVMFFGMAMSRMFMGLIKTSTGWLGVWELLSVALGILFLPLAKKFLEWTIKFLKWVTKLTKEEKKFWNRLVLVGLIAGILIGLFGTLVLGIGSMMLAFSFLFSPMGLVISALVALGGFFFLKDMFNDVGEAVGFAEGKLIAFGISADAIDTVKDKFRDMISTISTMTQEWTDIGISVAKGLIDGVVAYFKSNPLIIVGAIVGAFLGGPAGAAIGAAIGSLFSNINMEDITELLDSGLEMLDQLIQGVMNNLDKLIEIVTTITEKLTTFVIEHIDEFIEIGARIGLAIIKGMGQAIGKQFGKLDRFIEGKIPGKTLGSAFEDAQSGGGVKNDFIWRSGQGATSINPNDTVVGFKGSPPDFGGGSGSVTNNFYGFTMEELKRELDDRDRQMVSQMEANR